MAIVELRYGRLARGRRFIGVLEIGVRKPLDGGLPH